MPATDKPVKKRTVFFYLLGAFLICIVTLLWVEYAQARTLVNLFCAAIGTVALIFFFLTDTRRKPRP